MVLESPTSPAERSEVLQQRGRDAELTRADILSVATKEFAMRGFSGARVDAIARQTRTSKRMIYYYFDSKEKLYLAVLENAYRRIRDIESSLALDGCDPVSAISQIVDATFEYDEANPDFIRLVSIENIHYGHNLRNIQSINSLNRRIIESISRIVVQGQQKGTFRDDIDPTDVHMIISALCVFRIANRHTFELIFDVDFSAPERREKHKSLIREAVLRVLAKS